MRAPWLLLSAAPALAAVAGSVVNGTTGQLMPGIEVALREPGAKRAVATTASDAHGRFHIDRKIEGAYMACALFDGVPYETGPFDPSSAEGVTLIVYRSSPEPGPARVARHTVRLAPENGTLTVAETFVYVNEGVVTWNDPRGRSMRVYVPADAEVRSVRVTPPGSAAPQLQPAEGAKPGVFQLAFPVRPGETRINLTYRVPYAKGAIYHGEVATHAEETTVTASDGFKLAGAGLRARVSDYLAIAGSFDVALIATRPASATRNPAPERTARPSSKSCRKC